MYWGLYWGPLISGNYHLVWGAKRIGTGFGKMLLVYCMDLSGTRTMLVIQESEESPHSSGAFSKR